MTNSEIEMKIRMLDTDGLIAVSLLNHLNLGSFNEFPEPATTTIIDDLIIRGSARCPKSCIRNEEDEIYYRMVQAKIKKVQTS